MIFSFFIILASSIAAALVAFFPTSTGYSSTVTTNMQTLASSAYVFNGLFPLDHIFSIILLMLALEIILLSFNIIRWLINIIPIVRV
jgi:hypothetical protein